MGSLSLEKSDFQTKIKSFFHTSNDRNSIIELPIDNFPPKTTIFYNEECTNDLTILIFRDSLTTSLIPFITPHFKKTIYVWDYFNQVIVDQVQPDIVVEAYAERLFK